MEYSLFRNLIFNISFLVLIAHFFSRISILKKQILDNGRDAKGHLLLILFFSIISILSTYIGVGVNGAIVNTRAICVLSAGMLGGPVVGMGTAIITGLHRWLSDIGGFTAVSCACSTVFVEGILGSILHRPFQSGKLNCPRLILITGIAEIGQMALILLIARPFFAAMELVQIIALPMILTNSFGITAFIGAFQYIFLEQDSLADRKVHQAMYIAEQCLPHLRKGLSNQKELDATTEIICQNSICTGAAIVDKDCTLSCYGNLYMKTIPAFIQQAMQEKKCLIAHTAKSCPELADLLSDHVAVAAPLVSGDSSSSIGCLVLLEPKRWTNPNKEYLFAESLASLFSTQLELSQIAYQKELLRKAEFNRLQSQVDPHFLFNSLNTISFFCRSKPDRAKELLLLLAKFYRFSTKQEDTFVSLSKELEYIDIYLQLEKARYEEKLILEQNIIGQPLFDVQVPRLILQPIVENAIKHGISPDGSHYVCIQIEQTDSHSIIQISDHGTGFPEEILMGLYNDSINDDHIGLVNVDRRLKCFYGANSGLSIDSTPEGSTITIQIPLNKEDSHENTNCR